MSVFLISNDSGLPKLLKELCPDIESDTELDVLCDIKINSGNKFQLQKIDTSIFDDKSMYQTFQPIETSFCDYDNKSKRYTNVIPIIHFFGLYDERADLPFLPRKINFIDSSIWHFVAWNKDTFEQALKKIEWYRTKGYYDLLIAQESANLNKRLYNESIIYGNSEEGTHGANVVPFLFHSELEMEKKNAEFRNIFDRFLKNDVKVKWRILFIDDHSKNKMTTLQGKGKSNLTKKEIITHRLSEIASLLGLSKYDELFELKDEDCVENIEQSEEKILSKRYDLILVDYLLGEKDSCPQYGYEFLRNIKNNIDKNNRPEWLSAKGIYGRFWMIFSSGFTYAVQERLLTEGYSHNDKNWFIGRTACPTTTPELFKYNLLNFMNRQVEIITKLSFSQHAKEKIEKEGKQQITSLLDLLLFIYKEDKKSIFEKSVREYSGLFFNALLNLKANYDILKNDVCYNFSGDKASPLVKALFPDIEHYDNAFWEHLMHLVYLTAYGTIRQWPDMWEEFRFIRSNLLKAEKGLIEDKKVSPHIEAYIISLKSRSES